LPFGETLAEQRTSGAYNNVYKFTGKELDAETGLYYHGARYYDPGNSVWLGVEN
jgi:RHS repeat-associated protein